LLIVLSPAKRLDFAEPPVDLPATRHRFEEDVQSLSVTARRQTQADLRRLMGISSDLARLNQARFKAFDADSTEGLQAVLAFAGDVYQGLDARSLSTVDLGWAQDRLRILSGLYGLLRPLDRIQPYRHEIIDFLAAHRDPLAIGLVALCAVVAAPIAREGLPIGIQVIAAPWCEANALRVAMALEQLGVARVSVPAAFA
jgi:cytoplasmic iron level regulating protein YaaA (DUF328/UPF0246 family)